MTRRSAFFLVALLSLSFPAWTQEMLRTFTLAPGSDTGVTTDLIVRQPGATHFAYTPLANARMGTISAFDISRNQPLTVHAVGTKTSVALPGPLGEKAEFRLRMHESVPGTGLTLHRTLPKGRYVFVLPTGYDLAHSSLPVQLQTIDNQLNVGIVQPSDTQVALELAMKKTTSIASTSFEGNFLALDTRSVSYQLLDPKDHNMRLWLELYVTHPGQSHFYSQVRIPDNITDPVTVDMDRGVELPTRIVSGKEANAIGDAPSPFADDARVLVADLGYKVPQGGSARIRSYQTATDAPNYRLTNPNEFRLDRFIARTRTQYVLPKGWSLSLLDQPGTISRLDDGRVVIDFTGSSSSGSHLVLIAHRDTL